MRRLHSFHDCPSLIAIAAFLAAVAVVEPVAAESPPYSARVMAAAAPIRSGPGENFYSTDTLAQGDVVEVYREQPDGWLAIRPPEDSFSWVFGRHLKLLDGGLAEIDKDDVASRIGSRLSDKRNAVQVRLKRGEVVRIMGEDTVDGETWYKVAPPSGEFRWIHARHLEPSAPSAPAPPIVTTAATNDTPTTAKETATPAADAPAATGNDWRAAPIQSVAAIPSSNSTADAVAPPLSATAPTTTANVSATPPTSAAPPASVPVNVTAPSPFAAASPAPTPPPPPGPVADGLARQLTDLELRLSRMVAEPPVTWHIEPLEREAEQLLAQAQTVSDRDAVKVTLAKVDRFATIGRRYRQVASATPPGLVVARSPDRDIPLTEGLPGRAGSGDPRTTGAGSPLDASRYDAVGILRPVVSKRPGAPQFALIDERGQVLSFVTPTPDINLQPYLGHRVGVVGNRGFIPEFHRAHVTAGRVTPLDERLVR